MKSGNFKIKPYEPGQQYGLKQTRSLQSNSRLRTSQRKVLTPLKFKISGLKINMWHTSYADTRFSHFVKRRDGCCMKCGSRESLTNSHFFGRGNSSTRYLPENCDTLCLKCHMLWEARKQKGQAYYRFKVRQLGIERFLELESLSTTVVSRETAIKGCMKLLLVN